MTDDRFAIAERQVGGVVQRYWAQAPRCLGDVWTASRAHAGRDYLVYEDERYTYADAHRIVAGLAATLAGRYGLKRGDRFAVAMRNYPDWAFSFWAGVLLGAVAVPLNAWWSAPELAFALDDSGCSVVLADGERLERLAPVLAQRPDLAVVGVRPGALPSGPGEGAAGRVKPEDDAVILYTSGTTGR
ncbi:MAG TPA: class I adenylate-forming enzyme family protein, partial [Acidimicrobiia bacterium]|nr:class I adenylate-forming enzyme family protein [Acidimicrobiia bacterium]